MSSHFAVQPKKIHSYLSEMPTPILSREDLNALEDENAEMTRRCVIRKGTLASEFKGSIKNISEYAKRYPFCSARIFGTTLNDETLVSLNTKNKLYPANRFHFHNISYIQAEAPQKLMPGTRELYYQMAIESGANLLVAVVSGSEIDPEDPDKYMHFLSPGETIEIDGGTSISCTKEEVKAMGTSSHSPQIVLRTLTISKQGEADREIYQILPTFEPLAELNPQPKPRVEYSGELPPIPACSRAITEESSSIFNQAQQFIDWMSAIAVERNIQIDREHPLLVNCITGIDQSGMFIVLHTLYKDFFSSETFDSNILGNDLLTQIRGRALHVSSQSVRHAAVRAFDDLFKGLSERFPKGEDNTENLRQMIQTEYMKSILGLPRLAARNIKLAEERDEWKARYEELDRQLKMREKEEEVKAEQSASGCVIA